MQAGRRLTESVLSAIARGMPPVQCGKCDKPVIGATIVENMAGGLRLVFLCHDDLAMVDAPATFEDLKWWPRVVFAPPWKGYVRYPAAQPRHATPSKCSGCRR